MFGTIQKLHTVKHLVEGEPMNIHTEQGLIRTEGILKYAGLTKLKLNTTANLWASPYIIETQHISAGSMVPCLLVEDEIRANLFVSTHEPRSVTCRCLLQDQHSKVSDNIVTPTSTPPLYLVCLSIPSKTQAEETPISAPRLKRHEKYQVIIVLFSADEPPDTYRE